MATSASVQAGNPNRSIGFGLVLVMVALYGLWGLWQQFQSANVSASWPSVTGIIEASSLQESTALPGQSKSWTLKLRYLYTLENKEYAGSALHLRGSPTYTKAGNAQAAAARYREGTQVTVYYNPGDFSEAVLVPGAAVAGESMGGSACVLGLVLLLGVLAMIRGAQRLRSKTAS